MDNELWHGGQEPYRTAVPLRRGMKVRSRAEVAARRARLAGLPRPSEQGLARPSSPDRGGRPRNDVSDVRRSHIATPGGVRTQASAALSAKARLKKDKDDPLATEALGGPFQEKEAATAAAGMSRDPKKGEVSELRRRLERCARASCSSAPTPRAAARAASRIVRARARTRGSQPATRRATEAARRGRGRVPARWRRGGLQRQLWRWRLVGR
eukprot:2127474-Prymnesium_polylepis.1